MLFGKTPQPEVPLRNRTVSAALPERYAVRSNSFETAVLAVGAVALAASVAVLSVLRGQLPQEAAYVPLLALALAVVLLGLVKNRGTALSVDGETLTLRRWPQKPLSLTFADLLFVQTKGNRLVLWGRDRSALCVLNANMSGLYLLAADLQSRHIPVENTAAPPADAPPAAPGAHCLETVLEVPETVPPCYRLTCPQTLLRLVAVPGAVLAFLAVMNAIGGGPLSATVVLLVLTAVDLLFLATLVSARVEVADGRLRCRDRRFQTREFAFDDVAAVRQTMAVTGYGVLPAMELLDREGRVLARTNSLWTGSGFLLADLADREIPFTY